MDNSASQPIIPSLEAEITPEWTSKILNTSISKQNFQLESNIQSGSGFLSSMFRLSCTSEDEKPYKLIVKLLPEDPTMRSIVISEEFDKTEINFYKIAMPELIKILPELESNLCRTYYGHIQPEKGPEREHASILVMEDLKPQGYYTISFADEMSTDQSQEVLEFMAKLHYAGQALEKLKKQPLSKVYDFLQGSKDALLTEMARGGFVEVQEILKEHGGSQNVKDAFASLTPHSDKIVNLVQEASMKFPCLVHGDLWTNNLLFNKSPENGPTKVIDWQWLGYKDPCYDIAIMIISTIPAAQLNKATVDQQLQHYYKTYVKQCKDSKMEHLIKRDFEEFSKFFYQWGMSFTLLWFLLAGFPFSASFPRLVKIYEFLANDAKVPEFLLSQLS